ncbi:hypothetical protein AALO_G00268630 [Alosa alosa]|uniref:THAP-type domain-containing protein n=1 Tax=Alosa alosa TaxID=278164 RepID=A0AAV6FLP0_9TELE|nr:uncharacterized protein LOC125286245 isoform X1 [Alosa alosa]KAG5263793.1 hypothetical protein AALO_G00268630 [Alosa alosa]
MPGTRCCVKTCSGASRDCDGNRTNIQFFRFPTWKKHQGEHVSDVTRRRRIAWVAAIRRKDITFDHISQSMRVCSLHFHSGKPSYEMLENHSDWKPSLRLGHSDVLKTDEVRFQRSVRETSWTRADDVPVTPGQTVADPCESSKAPSTQVKKEDVIEVIIGETGERTNTTNVSESPETFTIEGRYGVGTWEQATVETIMSLRLLGTTVTTTQVAQTIIANLKDENDFLCEQNANLGAELKAMQWMHEQELRDLQERLEMLKQKCSCGAMSETTDTSSEAEHSDVMVAEIKTEPHDSGLDLQGNSIY